MQKLLIYLTFLIILFTHCTSEKHSKADQIDALVARGLEQGLFNGTVLVSYHGEVIYKSAFGYQDLETKTPLNISSAFYLASVSKQFTTMG